MKAFHQKFYGPSHLTLVFVGDVDAKAIQAQVAKAFGRWKGGVAVVRTVKAPSNEAMAEQTVDMKDKTSVSVLVGQPTGLRYQDAASLPLRIGAAVLGNGFTSRLMSTVRDKEGLTYGIGAGVSDDTFVDGTSRSVRLSHRRSCRKESSQRGGSSRSGMRAVSRLPNLPSARAR